MSNEGPLEALNLSFAGQTPAAAHILPPFIDVPGVHVCVSSYRGALTIAAVTSRNGVAPLARFFEAWIAELAVTAAVTGATKLGSVAHGAASGSVATT